MIFLLALRYLFNCFLLTFIALGFSSSAFAAGSCDNYTPDTNGTTVTCVASGSTSVGVISTSSNTGVGNGVTVNILDPATSLVINGSTIGLGSGAIVTNNGSLNTSSFYFGYGISSGANGRSQAGGSSITNNGSIVTGGTNAAGIYISATNAGSLANTIVNTGTITTSGTGANGIQVVNGGAITSINNSGTIAAAGANSNGIQVTGAATITNSGLICPSGVSGGNCIANGTGSGNGIQIDNNANSNRTTVTNTASGIIGAPNAANYAIYSAQQPGVDIYNSGIIRAATANSTAINFVGATSGGSNNSVTLYGGSTLVGGINFNKGNTQETLTFSGLTNTSFNNPITGLNVINATNAANIVMSSGAGYELVAGKVLVDGTSSLTISGVIQDQVLPSVAASSIQKTGAGTLTLSGANTYSGGTSLDGGTIAVGNNAALGTGSLTMANATTLQASSSVTLANAIAMSGSSTYDTNGNNLGLSGNITGVGALNKIGNGTLTLAGNNSYSGGTTVSAGSLILTGSITSNTTVASGANLLGSGVINGNVSNAGSIIPSFSGSQTNLTINGNYSGAGGVLATNIYAPVSNPVGDTLTVNGNTTGSTGIVVTDKGGLGFKTTGNGIPIVVVSGTSTTGAFYLARRVESGAYEYNLYKGGPLGVNNSWYLSTVPVDENSPPVEPDRAERIEVAVYPAFPTVVQLYSQTIVDTLDQRRGDLNLTNPQGTGTQNTNDWARIIGKTGSSTPSNINNGPKLNFNNYALQFGVDIFKDEEDGSRTYAGPYVTIGGLNGKTSNQAGTISTGNINGMQGYSIGLYATHFAKNGLYADALVQGTKYLNANVSSVQGNQLKTQGSGFTGSLEAGGRWNLGDKFLISPQAQIIYDSIGLNNTTDAGGQINFNKSEGSRGRLGILAGHKDTIGTTPIFAYLRASYWKSFSPTTTTTFASLYGADPVSFQSQAASNWMTIDAEINARITKDTSLFLNLAMDNSFVGTYQAYSGRIGLQTRF